MSFAYQHRALNKINNCQIILYWLTLYPYPPGAASVDTIISIIIIITCINTWNPVRGRPGIEDDARGEDGRGEPLIL